ncbi:MAG: hypothetical protein ACTSUE_05485 [Promethearchaeota archaeon]
MVKNGWLHRRDLPDGPRSENRRNSFERARAGDLIATHDVTAISLVPAIALTQVEGAVHFPYVSTDRTAQRA